MKTILKIPGKGKAMIPNSPDDFDVRKVAASQKWIIRLIVVNFCIYILYFALAPKTPAFAPVLNILFIANGIASIVQIYKLAKALHRFAIGYAICGFLPLIGFLTLLVLNSQATKQLQGRGIRVGFFGANDADLARLATSVQV